MKEMGRVERLVDDLLALARLDEGVGPELREVEVVPFLRDLADAEPDQAPRSASSAAGTIASDPDLLAQVVRNLLSNAHRHAGPAGRVALSAKAEGGPSSSSSTTTARASRPAERERVFDRFHRSEVARDRAIGRQRPGPRDRPLDRRAARGPHLDRRLAAGRGPGLLRAAGLPRRR